jgi:hypothetical protein
MRRDRLHGESRKLQRLRRIRVFVSAEELFSHASSDDAVAKVAAAVGAAAEYVAAVKPAEELVHIHRPLESGSRSLRA